jgi:choline kinase
MSRSFGRDGDGEQRNEISAILICAATNLKLSQSMTEVIIPAAGLGTRLGEHKEGNPKSLVDLDGTTVLEYQLKILDEIGIPPGDVYVIIGTTGDCWTQKAYDRLTKLHDQVLLNFENTDRGPAFTLELGLQEVSSDSVLILDGDIVVLKEMLETVYTDKNDSVLASKSADSDGEPGSKILTDDTGCVRSIGKDIDTGGESHHIYAGFCKLSGEALSRMKAVVGDETDRDVADVLDEVCREATVSNHELSSGWVNINTPEDLETARKIVNDF